MADSDERRRTVALPAELWRQLRRQAAEQDTTSKALIARYVAEGLERDSKAG